MTNFVNWPTSEDYRDTGEGGLWAYAFWLANNHDAACCGVTSVIALPQQDVVLNYDSLVYPPIGYGREDEAAYYGAPVIGALLLGSTFNSLANDDDYFMVSYSDLTPPGQAVIDKLNNLYNRQAVIVTYLDT
jgi:hypothetical protein